MAKNENPVGVPTRQSAVALLFIIGTFFTRILRQAWPLLIFAYFKPSDDHRAKFLLWVILAIAVTTLVISLLNYFRFYFWIENGALVIEKGVLKRSRVAIPFERIQTINSEQNIFYRYFNVVKIDLDTAGSKGKEATIQAISISLAEDIREFILEQKQQLVPAVDVEQVAENTGEPVAGAGKSILRLNTTDLLKIGLSQDHFRAILILMAFAFSRFEDAREILGDQFNEYLDQVSDSTLLNNMYAIFIMLLLIAGISFIISLLRTFFTYYGFTLVETATGLKTFSGLLTRRERHMNFRKMQIFQYVTGPIRRFFGLFSVKIFQVSSDDLKAKDAMTIPGCYEKELETLRRLFFHEGELPAELDHRIHRSVIIRTTLFSGLLPAIGATAVLIMLSEPLYWSLPIIYLVFIAVRAWLYHKNFRFGFSEEAMMVKSGNLNRKHRAVSFYKIQSVGIGQTIFQKRRQLANLTLYTAAGDVTLPYITLEQAQLLQNYVLYKIESEERSWM